MDHKTRKAHDMPSITRSGTLGGGRTLHGGFFPHLHRILATWRQRRDLASLDDALLRDIGLTRHEAMLESRRPLWDVPATWRK
jgi:uncharacterized protein YjiS (DUF1127 family)